MSLALLASPDHAQPAFETVFAEMGPYVVRVVRRMGVPAADVEDVVQDVFLAVHRGLPEFEGRSTIRTWVYGICVFACTNHLRRAYRRREAPTAEIEALTLEHDAQRPQRGADRALETDRELAALDAALTALPPEQRSVFVLFEIEGLEMCEVAAAAGCSKFTTYARLYAARKRVRAALARHQAGGSS